MATEAEVREWYAAECILGLPRWGSFDRLLVGVLLAAIDAERLRADKLQAFKEFVHRYLSQHGVPEGDPENPHQKEGCRIGARLDLLLAERDRLAALLEGLAHDDGDVKATGEYVARRFQEVRAERDRLAALLKKVEQEVAAWGEQAPMESDDDGRDD